MAALRTKLALLISMPFALYARDPFLGNWKLSLAKSTCDPSDRPIKAATESYKRVGDSIFVKWQVVQSNGDKQSGRYTAKCDGRIYPVVDSTQTDDEIACAQINKYLIRGNLLKNGTLVGTYERAVSIDEKVLTLKFFGVPPDSKHLKKVFIYQRK